MTIDKMIDELLKMRDIVGGNAEVPVVRVDYGENDYILPKYGVTGKFEDQDGKKFKCALIGEDGGEEFTKENEVHYEWKPKKDRV